MFCRFSGIGVGHLAQKEHGDTPRLVIEPLEGSHDDDDDEGLVAQEDSNGRSGDEGYIGHEWEDEDIADDDDDDDEGSESGDDDDDDDESSESGDDDSSSNEDGEEES
jgi:hypothetical protein